MLCYVGDVATLGYRRAMDRGDVTAGAKRIAASLEEPFGRRRLQPVIAEYLDYLAKARASGALWTQIADVLGSGLIISS
jgi:hypothetical protein